MLVILVSLQNKKDKQGASRKTCPLEWKRHPPGRLDAWSPGSSARRRRDMSLRDVASRDRWLGSRTCGLELVLVFDLGMTGFGFRYWIYRMSHSGGAQKRCFYFAKEAGIEARKAMGPFCEGHGGFLKLAFQPWGSLAGFIIKGNPKNRGCPDVRTSNCEGRS